MDLDRMVAPLPELILWALSTGTYYRMEAACGQPFLQYFGHVFGAYVGRILGHSFPASAVLSERDIRAGGYTDRMGKCRTGWCWKGTGLC